jgi:hypothetical protein
VTLLMEGLALDAASVNLIDPLWVELLDAVTPMVNDAGHDGQPLYLNRPTA